MRRESTRPCTASFAAAAKLSSNAPGSGIPDTGIIYDADPNQPDAEPPRCPEESLEIGGCEQVPDGGPCTGSPKQTAFVSISENGPIRVVLGPQGADMMVFALRRSGIDPGDQDNPASTAARPSFVDFGTEAVNEEAVGVFLLIERAVNAGDVFRAVAEVQDQNGEYRCGNLLFQAEFWALSGMRLAAQAWAFTSATESSKTPPPW